MGPTQCPQPLLVVWVRKWVKDEWGREPCSDKRACRGRCVKDTPTGCADCPRHRPVSPGEPFKLQKSMAKYPADQSHQTSKVSCCCLKTWSDIPRCIIPGEACASTSSFLGHWCTKSQDAWAWVTDGSAKLKPVECVGLLQL